jgi:hypothetical protein
MSKCCWPLRGIVRQRSAGISMSAPAVHIVLRVKVWMPIGEQTVQYVSNIYKYYVAYKLVLE